ncbi:MAG: DUF1311 domain-containing protein [Xanthobacteraceae bacterium]|nr:DUF1311 domain-containing protein [Xanthobacteraceae bacterium]
MTAIRLAFSALVAVGVLSHAGPGIAQNPKQAGQDSSVIQSCIKSVKGAATNAERCIGLIANPCLRRPGALSNADAVACASRESSVWDDILNETFRRLGGKLDAEQNVKLRDMQRAWIESRDRTCAFYYDFHQGSIAVPMSAVCVNRETARRALFLLDFLNDTEGR